MRKLKSCLVFFLSVFFLGPANVVNAANCAGGLEAVRAIKKVVVDVPAIVDEAKQSQIIEMLRGMKKARFVYLDLSIHYAHRGPQETPYSVVIKGKPYEGNKGAETLLMGKGVVYHLGPVAGYNHLLLSIYSGDRADFPYHDISRDYAGGGEDSLFHVQGFFYVLSRIVPTADSLHLRPFTPPLEIAARVLAR